MTDAAPTPSTRSTPSPAAQAPATSPAPAASPAPSDPACWREAARAALQANEAEAAAPPLVAWLATHPQDAEALHLLGITRGMQGRLEEALALFEQALAVAGEAPALHEDRAQALLRLQRADEALAGLNHALQRWPAHSKMLAMRCWLHAQRGEPLDALRDVEAALALRPDDTALQMTRGNLRARLSELGFDLRAQAAQDFRAALARRGQDDRGEFFAAALGGQPPPERPPEGYVRELFDAYAQRFDNHLRHELAYRAPEAALRALDAAGLSHFERVLDLGCGTGLMGALLRPRSTRLDGVDLSPAMVEEARAAGHYDGLHVAEIEQHLATLEAAVPGQGHDLLVACDVLVYLGALETLFAASRRVLRGGGHLLVTVEELASGPETQGAPGRAGPDYALHTRRRYAHREGYLRRLAAETGFEVVSVARETLRQESELDVAGLVVLLRVPLPAG